MTADGKKKASQEPVVTPSGNEPLSSMPSPIGLLRESIKQFPAFHFVWGVVGIIAVVAIVSQLGLSWQAAVFGGLVVFVALVLMPLYQWLTRMKGHHFQTPLIILIWFVLALVVVICSLLVSSTFFNWPKKIGDLIGQPEVKTKPIDQPQPPTPADGNPEKKPEIGYRIQPRVYATRTIAKGLKIGELDSVTDVRWEVAAQSAARNIKNLLRKTFLDNRAPYELSIDFSDRTGNEPLIKPEDNRRKEILWIIDTSGKDHVDLKNAKEFFEAMKNHAGKGPAVHLHVDQPGYELLYVDISPATKKKFELKVDDKPLPVAIRFSDDSAVRKLELLSAVANELQKDGVEVLFQNDYEARKKEYEKIKLSLTDPGNPTPTANAGKRMPILRENRVSAIVELECHEFNIQSKSNP